MTALGPKLAFGRPSVAAPVRGVIEAGLGRSRWPRSQWANRRRRMFDRGVGCGRNRLPLKPARTCQANP
jgi:hypothetical protein